MPRISAKMMTEITYNPLNLEPGDEVWMAMWRIAGLPEHIAIFVEPVIVDTKATGGKIHVRSPMLEPGYGFDPTYYTDYTSTAAVTKEKQGAVRWIEREVERLRKKLSPAAMSRVDDRYALFTKTLSSREILSAKIDNGEIECHEFRQK